MHKVLNILAALAIVTSLVFTVTIPVYADDITYLWTVGSGGAHFSGTSSADELTAEWHGVDTRVDPHFAGTPEYGANLSCTGSADCIPDQVYADITIHASWTGGSPDATYYNLYVVDTVYPCAGDAVAGECDVHLFLTLDSSASTTAYNAIIVFLLQTDYTMSDPPTIFTYTFDIVYSLDPVDNCSEDYQTVETVVEETSIDPTSEIGEYALLNQGTQYRLTVGGYWNDSATDRQDTAIKQGDGEYLPISTFSGDEDVVECVQNNPEDAGKMEIIFTASADEFYIRVNDIVGQFSDNTADEEDPVSFQIDLVTPTSGGASCSSQYLAGATLGVITLPATSISGVNLRTALGSSYPAAGSHFIIEVTGQWYNGGTGDPLQTIAVTYSNWTDWLDASVSTTTGCYDETNATYYMQMTEVTASMSVRVADHDANFGTNTGTLTLTIKAVASYEAFQNGCELSYSIGDYIEQGTIHGDWSNGWPIDEELRKWDPTGSSYYSTPVRYYMLETFGGPIDLGNSLTSVDNYTWDVDLAQRGVYTSTYYGAYYTEPFGRILPYENTEGEWYYYEKTDLEWHNAMTAPFVTCASQIDQVGHARFYFIMDDQVDLYEFIRNKFAIRARDTGNYTDNTGTISYRLYEATLLQDNDPGIEPQPDGCGRYAHDATVLATIPVDPQDSDGRTFPLILPNNGLYAFEVSGGPWTDNTVPSYILEISSDDGDNWYELADYDYLLCSSSSDGDHHVIYIKAAYGQAWRVRVADGDSNFGNNAGTISLKVYNASTSLDDVWVDCENNYTMTQVPLADSDRNIPAKLEDGVTVPQIVDGEVFAITVTGESMWYESGSTTGSYLLEISDDGGDTWQDFDDYDNASCTAMVGTAGRFQVFFTADGTDYLLRVRDGDDDFLGNTGEVYFYLYSAIDTSDPTWGDNAPDPEWISSCYQNYVRPDSLFQMVGLIPIPRVGDWLEYAKNSIIYFFAWCPQHTAALLGSTQIYLDKEPLASMIALSNLVKSIQASLQAVMDSQGSSEEGIESMEPDLFTDMGTGVETGSAAPGGFTNPVDLFVVGSVDRSTNNPLFGGQLDLTTISSGAGVTGQEAYVEQCEGKFFSLFGIGTNYYCTMLGMFRFTKFITWVLLVVDVIAVIWYVRYFVAWVERMWEVFTGEKRTINRVVKKALK